MGGEESFSNFSILSFVCLSSTFDVWIVLAKYSWCLNMWKALISKKKECVDNFAQVPIVLECVVNYRRIISLHSPSFMVLGISEVSTLVQFTAVLVTLRICLSFFHKIWLLVVSCELHSLPLLNSPIFHVKLSLGRKALCLWSNLFRFSVCMCVFATCIFWWQVHYLFQFFVRNKLSYRFFTKLN